MKATKILFKIAGFFFILAYVVSCNSKNPPVAELIAECNAYAVPTSVAYNGSATIYWDSKNVTSVTKNGVSVPISGSENLSALTKDTSISFVFTSLDGKTTTKIVPVAVLANPAPTRTDTLCSRYWTLTEEKYLINGVWSPTNLSDEQKTNRNYFYTNGKCETFKSNGQLIGNGTWSWAGNDINICGGILKYKLTDTTLVIYENNDTIVSIYTRK